jgi:hypothetical protein
MTKTYRRSDRRVVNSAVGAYLDWCTQCLKVEEAYRLWDIARPPRDGDAYRAYCEALDGEESAAGMFQTMSMRITDDGCVKPARIDVEIR